MCVISTDMTKEQVWQQLEQNTLRVIAVTDGVTDVYANVRPETGGWSIAEIIEHLALSDKSVYMSMRKAKELSVNDIRIGDDSIKKYMLENTSQIVAPDLIIPGKNIKLAGAIYDFNYWRDAIFDYLKKSGGSFDSRYAPHPFLGYLSRRQWLMFSLYHAERHIQQIFRAKSYLAQHN